MSSHNSLSSQKSPVTVVNKKLILLILWLTWATMATFLGIAWFVEVDASIRSTYLLTRGAALAACTLILGATYLGPTYLSKGFRILITLPAPTLSIVESLLAKQPDGYIFPFLVSIVGLGALFLFDPLTELRTCILLILAYVAVCLAAIGIQPQVGYLPRNPISANQLLFISLTIATGIGMYLIVRRLHQVLDQNRQLLQEQEEFVEELRVEKERVSEAYAEIQRLRVIEELEQLRAQERQRTQREAALARYETLMRESYGESVAEFLQRLLDRLAETLPMLGGVIYERIPEGWQVTSAYALREYMGRTCPGGTLTTAANLKATYVISPAPAGTAKIKTSVATLKPKAVLYLPFFSEATNETIAIAELLLTHSPDGPTEELLNELLPRVGTYLWARTASQKVSE